MIVLGLTGEKVGGKTTFSHYLMEKHQAKHYRFSQILDDILARLYLPNSRDNQIAVVQALRKEFGTEILAHILKKDIAKENPQLAVIDGIRFKEEVDIIKNLENFHLIYITASLEERFKRVKKRKEKADDATVTFEQFEAQENAPTEVKIQELKSQSDFVLENNGSLEEYYQKIEDLISKFKL